MACLCRDLRAYPGVWGFNRTSPREACTVNSQSVFQQKPCSQTIRCAHVTLLSMLPHQQHGTAAARRRKITSQHTHTHKTAGFPQRARIPRTIQSRCQPGKGMTTCNQAANLVARGVASRAVYRRVSHLLFVAYFPAPANAHVDAFYCHRVSHTHTNNARCAR